MIVPDIQPVLPDKPKHFLMFVQDLELKIEIIKTCLIPEKRRQRLICCNKMLQLLHTRYHAPLDAQQIAQPFITIRNGARDHFHRPA